MAAQILRLKDLPKKEPTKKQKEFLKKLLNGPVMTEEQYKEYQKINKWMRRWKA